VWLNASSNGRGAATYELVEAALCWRACVRDLGVGVGRTWELEVVGGEESWQKLEKLLYLDGLLGIIDLAETRRPRDSAGRQGHGQAYLQ
jgi:hypothetical protein